MNRIVSLIPSATEILCALGVEEQVVGRSHECDYPLSIQRLPVCTAPKFGTEGTSLQIDERVKTILQEALSLYRIDADLLKKLQPSHIVTQTQCEVCAVDLKEVERALCEFTGSKPILIPLSPNALSDVWADIQRVADALALPERGRRLVEALQNRMARIETKTLPSRPRVVSIEWMDPLMAGGNWMPELVERAGGINLFGEAGKHSPWMTWRELQEADPDLLLILPCGFDIQRTRKDLASLTGQGGWPDLKAVRDEKVYLLDGNQYFNRPGPRLVESLEILAEILHPGRFHFGHEGAGWQKLVSS
jgi:iron complex transport system substrate-binding protein